MKLIYKILLGYFLTISIIGVFSTFILLYNIEKYSTNLDTYREREITSFAKVIDAFLPNEASLHNTDRIQKLFLSTTKKLPHVKRLTLHAQNKKTLNYTHIASSVVEIIGTPSHQEDIDAILNNKTTLLYENTAYNDRYLDITYPILDENLKPIAALGIAVSLKSSDEILEKALSKMKSDAIDTIVTALSVSTFLALVISIIFSRKIIKPIEQLKNALSNTSTTNLPTELEITSKDEIGALTVAFNTMSSELNQLHNSMQQQIEKKSIELETQFFTDTLTGLDNRHALFKRTKQLENFHVSILDISSFKDINDVYGIEIGNQVLQELSKKYIYYLSDSHLELFRLSGDEMAILNPNVISSNSFLNLIEKIIKSIEHETFYFNNDEVEINISIHAGISLIKEHALEKANIALVQAKQSHSDYKVFDRLQHSDSKLEKNITTISKIKHAIENYGFSVYYQAIVNRNNKTIKYEALVRMKDDGKVLSPFHFLDVAKKTKYYQEITRNVIHNALEEFKNKDEYIAINLCAEDIENLKTQAFIKEKLAEFPNPQNVVFELVESEDIHALPELNRFIRFLKEQGAKIAIDDFGTGYSNFAYLMDLEPDYIKIDGSLIKNIAHDKRSYNIVNTIVTFAHGLNIKTIAEYVHSKEVLEICRELHIDEFQGYYFSEPLPLH